MRVFSLFLLVAVWPITPGTAEAADTTPVKVPAIWFDDVAFSIPVSDEQLRDVTVHLRNVILKGKPAADGQSGSGKDGEANDKAGDKAIDPQNHQQADKNSVVAKPALKWPASVRIDAQPRMVFISVSDSKKAARVALGTGKGLVAAAEDALSKLQLDAAENKVFEPQWLKVDIVANVFDQSGADLTKNMLFDRSLFGIAFSRKTGAAVLPEETIANELADHHQMLSLERFGKYLKQRTPTQAIDLAGVTPKKADLIRFNTRSMFADKDETAKLYRGHRMYDKLTKQQVLYAANLAKGYMLRSVDREGQFAFIYHADLNELEPRYSIGHHFSYIYSLLDTYEVIKDDRLLDAARRALDFGQLSVGSWLRRGNRVHCVIDETNNVYLRFNALATLSYAKLVKILGNKATDDDRDRLQRFALAITTAQRGDGYLILHQTYPDGRVHDEISSVVFYPGEAMVALYEVNRADPQKTWRDTLFKTANYVIQVRDKDRTESRMIQDPWTLIGMANAYRLEKQRIYVDHALKTARALRARHNIKVRYEDWFGGYFKPPGTLPTAVRTMSLAIAYELARDTKQTTEAAANLQAVIRGNAFLLQTQFTPEVAMYYKDPQRTLGAFRESLTVPTVRTDYVQHSLKSLLNLYQIMEADGVDTFDLKRPKPENAKDR